MFIYYLLTIYVITAYSVLKRLLLRKRNIISSERSILFCSVPFRSVPFCSVLFCSVLFLKSSTLIKCIHNLTCSNHSRNFLYIGGILLNIVTHFSPGVQWLQQNIFLWIVTFWFITSYNPVDGASDSEEHAASSFVVDMDQGVKI